MMKNHLKNIDIEKRNKIKYSKVFGASYIKEIGINGRKDGREYVMIRYGNEPPVEMLWTEYQGIKHERDPEKAWKYKRLRMKKREEKKREMEEYKSEQKQLRNELKDKKRVYGKPDIYKIQKYEKLIEKRLYSSKFDTQIIMQTDMNKLSFRVDEKKYSHFNMMVVRNELENPTKDTKNVQEMIDKYLKTRFKYLNGVRIQVELTFVESVMKYRTPEVYVDARLEDSEAIFKGLIHQKIQQWYIDQQKYDDANQFYCDAFTLYIDLSIKKGGCFKNKISIDGIKPCRLSKLLYTPFNRDDNNCLIYCMLYNSESKMNNRGVLKISKIADDAKKCQEIREQYFEGNNQIEISDIHIIAEHFKTKINLYTYENREFKLFESYGNYKKEANILLVGFHFHLILHDNLVKMKYCSKCRTMILDFKKHSKECNYCYKCKMTYMGSHTKSECTYNINHYTCENAIKVANKDKKFEANEKIIYADFETINEDGILKPYATAYAIDDGETVIYEGKDSIDKFVDDMITLKGKHTLVFYNGSRFDLYFVYQTLINKGINVEEKKFIFSNGSFKSLSFNKISTWDLNLHLAGSLRNNCKAFGVDSSKSKSEFDHRRIVSWKSVEELREEWMPYLKLDIISMRELYRLYANQIWNDFELNVNKYITLSSLAEKVWRISLKNRIDLLSFNDDEWVRRSIYGGRSYMTKQYFNSKDEEDYLVDTDVVSLYPTAMMNEYPTGGVVILDEPKQLKAIKELINNESFELYKYYIIECDITTNKKLVNSVLPSRNENGGLLWNLDNIENGVYNSIDIQRALNHGYTIDKIHRFMGFNNDNKCNIFKDYINQIFQMKKNSIKETPQYCVAKLLMNSLYGKMLQKPVIEKHSLIRTYEELEQIREENEIVGYKFISEDKLFVTYIPYDKDEQVRKPSYIGSFILGYSRQIMDKYYDSINAYTNIETCWYRCDTDSMIVHREQYEKFKELGFMQAGVLGMLDLDIRGKIMKYAEVAPKCYICEWEPFDEKDVEKLKKKDDVVWVGENRFYHIRCKSFSKKDQMNLTFKDYENMLFHKNAKESKQDLVDEYGNNYGFIFRKDDKVKLYMNDKLKKVGLNINSKQKERGITFSSITSESFERTINKTTWNKRQYIKGHENLASLPFYYEGKTNGKNNKMEAKLSK
jgi:hypothetical protein